MSRSRKIGVIASLLLILPSLAAGADTGKPVRATLWNDPTGNLATQEVQPAQSHRQASLEEQLAGARLRAEEAARQAAAARLALAKAEQAARENAETERLRTEAVREREQADLERLRAMAAREKEEAELERLRQMAARERAEAAAATTAELPQAPVAAPPRSFIPAAAETASGNYAIGAGDVLEILVWKDETLSRAVMVKPDGHFVFPLLGEVLAEGKTVGQLKAELEGKLAPYVPEPVLSLEVKQANSMIVYVLGRVNSPGRYPIASNISVLQALAMAGGLNPFADEKGIRVMRQEGEETRTYRFNYKQVVRGKALEENIRLQRGDVIVVP